MAGKLKMVLQCLAAGVGLFWLHYPSEILAGGAVASDAPAWCSWLLAGSVWTAVALTVYSGLGYVVAAVKLLRA